MIKKVQKNTSGLKGEIIIPSDKSISHRAIMFSALAEGEAVIKNFSLGTDCRTTLELYKTLGLDLEYIDRKTLKVKSRGCLISQGINNVYSCGNSGTTMRLSAGILAGQNFDSVLTGDDSLSKRPMRRIIEPLTLMGAEIKSTDNHAPLLIKGKSLNGIFYKSNLSSAQVKSCVLLAGLHADGTTSYVEPHKSRDHTERMLKYLGADIKVNGNLVEITKSKLQARDIEIVGDISSAAFFMVAALIVPNSTVIIKNVGINSTRIGIIEIIKRMGGNIELKHQRVVSGEEIADIKISYTEKLKACAISGDDIPKLIDELPVIAVLATQCEGQTIVKDASDLRNKETNRITCLVNELKKLGADIQETKDGFIVNGKSELTGGVEVESYKDHRLGMSFYVVGLICKKEILISGFEWINISFPEFEEFFNQIQNDFT